MTPTQLHLWEQPRRLTVAQYVYRVWLWFYRGGNKPHYYPSNNKVMEQTVKYLDLPEDLVRRIVGVQSRWEARKVLRGIKKIMTIIHCKQCHTQINWDDQKRQYARLLKRGFTEQEAKEKLPLCHKCVTRTPKPPKVKKSQV